MVCALAHAVCGNLPACGSLVLCALPHAAPNGFIYLASIRAVVMASGLLTLGRRSAEDSRVKNLVSPNA
jgi:hypothetical protein